MKTKVATLLLAAGVALAGSAAAGEFDSAVPMKSKGSSTFYVPGHIEGLGAVELMVDTGSSYITINEEALAVLTRHDRAKYLRNLRGTLANGHEVVVPVYTIDVKIGDVCHLRQVEAAVFPGKTRYILGLNALSQAAPFIFSTDPATLVLSHCTVEPTAAKVDLQGKAARAMKAAALKTASAE